MGFNELNERYENAQDGRRQAAENAQEILDQINARVEELAYELIAQVRKEIGVDEMDAIGLIYSTLLSHPDWKRYGVKP